MRRICNLINILLLCLVTVPAMAGDFDPDKVPENLQQWIPWVQEKHPELACPVMLNQSALRVCAWPGKLELNIDKSGAVFRQQWNVYATSEVMLPGDNKHWPQNVKIDNRVVPVYSRQGSPVISLEKGSYTVSGNFNWQKLPRSIGLPVTAGQVDLRISGKAINFPERKNGQLYLNVDEQVKAEQTDTINFKVYRLLTESIPFMITTRLQLDVSGKQREINLKNILPADFIPLAIQSPLPVQLDSNGIMKMQVRAGQWTITLRARSSKDVTDIKMPGMKQGDTEINEEVWLYEANPSVRTVEIKGLSIDVRQTQAPNAWHQYPAYLVNKEQAGVTVSVLRRGDPQPNPDQLKLSKTIWLDFDGNGYTVQDNLTGNINRGWRLSVNPQQQLGRVDINGEPQFITRLSEQQQDVGVEVRRGKINLQADSRIQEPGSKLMATGWLHDVDSLKTVLNLPPGWTLFTASGVDKVSNSWVQRWTLLDLFMVLILALAVQRLWGWKWGSFFLASLVIVWHAEWAPRYVWIHVLLSIALLRAVSTGKFIWVLKWYRNLSVLGLVLISIVFSVYQVRTGLYPQLTHPSWLLGNDSYVARSRSVADEVMSEPLKEEKLGIKSKSYNRPSESEESPRKLSAPASMDMEYIGANQFANIDPSANLQTGPGLPNWRWNTVKLNWSGPVKADQAMKLYLVSPGVNRVMNFIKVILVLVMIALVVGVYKQGRQLKVDWQSPLKTLALLIGVALLFNPADEALAKQEAGYPSVELLKELEQRLIASPECLPDCAEIANAELKLDSRVLQIEFEVHAQQAVAIPLANAKQNWQIQLVTLDDKVHNNLFRESEHKLWLGLEKGIHRVRLTGVLSDADQFTLSFPLKPRYVKVSSSQWNVEGLLENGQITSELQFVRRDNTVSKDTARSTRTQYNVSLPDFVKVERTLRLGLSWEVDTRVLRQSETGSAIVLNIPLLKGESPTTADLNVKDNKVLVNLSPRQGMMYWHSVLEQAPEIKLDAVETKDWVEVWRVDISPVWHLQTSGIAPVHHQDPKNNWLPEWRPWPGESVTLNITRPVGIKGQTLTIDQSKLHITPGQRATDYILTLQLRSSQGGQHDIQLPTGSDLQSVIINKRSQPLRLQDDVLSLPVTPGEQTIEVKWRDSHGIKTLYKSQSINLGIDNTNLSTKLKLESNRWVLLTGGTMVGPAVLYWGILIVIVLIAIALGKVKTTPLKTRDWVLLSIGLSQVPLFMAAFVVIWLLILGWRNTTTRLPKEQMWFNVMQAGLGFISVMAVIFLFIAVDQGLLGHPQMQVAGNQSSSRLMNWYQDRSAAQIPTVWVMSVPIIVYRVLMLAWALWLAFSLLNWLRWGWKAYVREGIWKSQTAVIMPAKEGSARLPDKLNADKSSSDKSGPDDSGKPELPGK